jgi:hypothetical protein
MIMNPCGKHMPERGNIMDNSQSLIQAINFYFSKSLQALFS